MIYFIFSVWGTVCLALGIKRVNDVSTPPPNRTYLMKMLKTLAEDI